MKNLEMKKKIVISFGTIIVCFVIALIITISGMNNTGSRYTTFFTMRHEATMRARNMRLQLNVLSKYLLLATVAEDITETNNSIAEVEGSVDAIKSDMAWFEANFDGDMSLITQFDTKMTSVQSARDQIMSLARENTAESNAQAQLMMLREYNPVVSEAADLIKEFNDNQNTIAANNYNNAMDSQRLQMTLSIIFSIVAVALAVAMALMLIRAVVTPVQEMQSVMKDMEEGNLNVKVKYQSKDELGRLADSMRATLEFLRNVIKDVDYLLASLSSGDFTVHSRIADKYVGDYESMLTSIRKLKQNLSSTLSQINEAADQVSSGSDQVSSGAQALSQGATEQASSVQELAATINEISNNISQNADNARSASDKSEEVKEQANESSKRMQELLSAMDDISNTSGEIGKIVKNIEDIAFQTNILALNAAVEAARAGAAGKGFAVVADEVRNLASKSAEASKNTSTLIESTLQAVEKGAKIANGTAQALSEVVTGVDDVAGTISHISTASEEQADAVKQVTLGIDQISSVVQTNSATAEESAAASEELSGQAQMLKDLVGQFKLSEGSSLPVMASQPAPVTHSSDSFGVSHPFSGGSKY